MTHVSLCKRTHKNGMRFQGSGAFCILALLFLAAGNMLAQSAGPTVTTSSLPNGVAGQPVLRPDGMTGIKIEAVSLYTCAKAEQKGFLVSTGYVLNSPALARAAARSAAAAASAPPAAPGSGAATTPAGFASSSTMRSPKSPTNAPAAKAC